jgi:hypothetical protein
MDSCVETIYSRDEEYFWWQEEIRMSRQLRRAAWGESLGTLAINLGTRRALKMTSPAKFFAGDKFNLNGPSRTGSAPNTSRQLLSLSLPSKFSVPLSAHLSSLRVISTFPATAQLRQAIYTRIASHRSVRRKVSPPITSPIAVLISAANHFFFSGINGCYASARHICFFSSDPGCSSHGCHRFVCTLSSWGL